MSLFDFQGNEIRDWSPIPSMELWRYMIAFSRGDKHAAEMEFRKVMKHRNYPQFKTEKLLDRYLGADASTAFETKNLLDIYEQDFQSQHIIPNFLVGGQVTIVHGASGSGKSTLVKQAIRSVLTGEPFIERSVVKGGVLLIELDEPTAWTAKTLIDYMGLPSDAARRLQIVDQVSAGEGIGSLDKYLSGNSDIRLVVIDTLQSFCQVENLNDNSEVGRVMQGLRDLLKTHKDTAALFIHHSNKSGGFLGAQIIMGSCDILFKFEMDPEREYTNRLICEKWRTIQKQPMVSLRWDQATHLYTSVQTIGPAKQKANAEAERRDAIVAHLKAKGGVSTQPAIFDDDSIKGGEKVIRSTLQRMEHDLILARKERRGSATEVALQESYLAAPLSCPVPEAYEDRVSRN